MLNSFYSLIREIVAFTLIVSLVCSLASHTDYEKYIRFFSEIIFILIILKPIGNLFLGDLDFEKFLEKNMVQYERKELEEELRIADEKTGEAVLCRYKEALEKDMEEKLAGVGYIRRVTVSLYTGKDHYGEIKSIVVQPKGAGEEEETAENIEVSPIEIEEIVITGDGSITGLKGSGADTREERIPEKLQEDEKEIRNILCTFYDIKKSRISFLQTG